MSRPWLALVLILFCLPLFINLRGFDLETDEAIYSFAVDRILEVGDWLEPKSSPSETAVFLEKPPLKFWIVAAPIRLGLLPHDEFGLRFWDAAFGGAAFLYVFAIGSRLAGPVCGGVAVLLLFVHWPLLLDHGLRTNNMEGPLFLCYCGGVYHALRWAALDGSRRAWHALGAGLFFVLGFMTKFVAAIFLPAVLGLPILVFGATRRKLIADSRIWLGVAGLAAALIVPWFFYAQVKFGSLLWQTMLGAHVYERFTIGLNQAHVHPWNYYGLMMWEGFSRSGLQWLVPVGLTVLLLQTIRRRWFEGAVVFLWATLPLLLISAGSSKLYHYAYPFLPPLTIAVGYVLALIMMLAPVLVRKILERAEDVVARLAPAVAEAASWRGTRVAGTSIMAVSAALLLGALVFGVVRAEIAGTQVFKSSGPFRPMAAILIAGLFTRRSASASRLLVGLAIAWCLPVAVYEATFAQLRAERHPLRDAALCVRGVDRANGARGLYVDSDSSMWHPIYYYFRRLQPWTRQETLAPGQLDANLHDPNGYRASMVQENRYRDYVQGPDRLRFTAGVSPPMISLFEYVLLLPGPFGACSPEAALRTP